MLPFLIPGVSVWVCICGGSVSGRRYSRGMMPWSASCSCVLLCWSLSCRTEVRGGWGGGRKARRWQGRAKTKKRERDEGERWESAETQVRVRQQGEKEAKNSCHWKCSASSSTESYITDRPGELAALFCLSGWILRLGTSTWTSCMYICIQQTVEEKKEKTTPLTPKCFC